MKILKVLGILILVVVVIGLIASLILPKEMNVKAEQTIDAPISVVWDNVRTFQKADKWSPWYDVDPDMKVDFDGEEGAVGSSMTWSGNKDVGSGTMTITKSDAENHVIEMNVKHDFGEGNSNMTLTEEDGKVKVMYTYLEEQGMPGNLLGAIFGAEKMMTDVFNKELGLLKDLAEKEAEEMAKKPAYVVEEIQRDVMYFVGKKTKLPMAEMGPYFNETMQTLGQQCGPMMTGPMSALYWDWDEETQTTELTAAAPVGPDAKAPEGFEIYERPAGMYITVTHMGNYEGVGEAHNTLETYMKSKNLSWVEGGPAMEEYVVSQATEPDTAKWQTRILYPVMMAEAPIAE